MYRGSGWPAPTRSSAARNTRTRRGSGSSTQRSSSTRSIGAAQTTISEIAKRAGVGRVTVYRHFPDEETLFRACSGHYFSQHPFPASARWRRIPDPVERLATGLRESYAWHDENAADDQAWHSPKPVTLPIVAPYHAYWDNAAETLAAALAHPRTATQPT